MKKEYFKSLLLVSVSAALILSVTSCGNANNNRNASSGSFVNEASDVQIAESKSDSDASAKDESADEVMAEEESTDKDSADKDSTDEENKLIMPGFMVLGANRQDEEIKAYADFLADYMDHPAVSTLYKDDFEETDEPVDKSSVCFELIYLDDDDVCELAVANGDCPWNPVHVFSFLDGKVEHCGEYSMYGLMYYSPKKSYVLPMYYFPAMETDIEIYGTNKTITFKPGEDEKYFLKLFDSKAVLLSDVRDMEAELIRMKETAPIGITPLGAPISDDSYLKEGESKIEGDYGNELPGIWYRYTEDSDFPTWIEVDTNGTFTAYDFDGLIAATGYVHYYGDSPILRNGYIYNFKSSDGSEYMDFEMAPVKGYGYMLDYCGTIYYKNPEKWDEISASLNDGADISYENNTITIEGKTFDISDYVPECNSVTCYTEAGDWIVVQGYIEPQKNVYEFYNVYSRNFEYEIIAQDLDWWEEDIATTVYLADNAIYDIFGNMFAWADADEDIWYVTCKNDHTVKVRCQQKSDELGTTYFRDIEHQNYDHAMFDYYAAVVSDEDSAWKNFENQAPEGAYGFIMQNPPARFLENEKFVNAIRKNRAKWDAGSYAAETVIYVSLCDGEKIRLESNELNEKGVIKYSSDDYKLDKGEPAQFGVTAISEAYPLDNIMISTDGVREYIYPIEQLSGEHVQRSEFLTK